VDFAEEDGMRIGVGLPVKDLGDPGATGPFESDITVEQLQQIRSLLPADPGRPRPVWRRPITWELPHDRHS
jgi:hypothetical protein